MLAFDRNSFGAAGKILVAYLAEQSFVAAIFFLGAAGVPASMISALERLSATKGSRMTASATMIGFGGRTAGTVSGRTDAKVSLDSATA